jgi:hypothetical protein
LALVTRLKVSGKNPALRQAPDRYLQAADTNSEKRKIIERRNELKTL